MMFLVGLEMLKMIQGLKGWGIRIAILTGAVSLMTNMAVGFGVGLVAAYVIRFLVHRSKLPRACKSPNPA
jgi:hypothetical protein